jgi:3-deoxy-D-manno-octulosonic-acid transferase
MENFRDIARAFLEAGAAVEVRDPRDLARSVNKLLENDSDRKKMGDRARQLMEQGAGATQSTMEQLRILLDVSIPTHTEI